MPRTADFPLADADLCVKCGLCLPHCPTYLDSRNEADSPRGRIALMQGLATDLIPQTPKLEAHLDGCLSCRACERVCPAQVPYGALIDAGRSLLAARRPARTRWLALLSMVLANRPSRHAAGGLLRIYQHSGLQSLLRRSALLGHGRLARLEGLLPQHHVIPAKAGIRSRETLRSDLDSEFDSDFRRNDESKVNQTFTTRRATAAPGATTVHLFVGCVGDLLERAVLADAQRLFEACGYAVAIPKAQTCCGALDAHGGRASAAKLLAAINASAFTGDGPVAALASGCGASLLDSAKLLETPEARAFAARVRDPARLLLERAERLRLQACKARVAIHLPCTQANALRDARATPELLARIPGIELFDLDPGFGCCGAAGLHFVTQPDAADRLLEPKLAAVKKLAPELIVSANIGCNLHLAAGLRRAGLRVPVLHPLSLLAQQLA